MLPSSSAQPVPAVHLPGQPPIVFYNGHTCSCPAARSPDFPSRLEGAVTPCALHLQQHSALRYLRHNWHKHNGKLRYSTLLLASPFNPQPAPASASPVSPQVQVKSRPLIDAAGREVARDAASSSSSVLRGTIADVNTVQHWFQENFVHPTDTEPRPCYRRFSVQARTHFKMEDARAKIEAFFQQPEAADVSVFLLYYTGHGVGDDAQGTGDWVFDGGVITFAEVREMWLRAGRRPDQLLAIVADCCYSGQWIREARRVHVAAAEAEQPMCSIGLITASDWNEKSYDRLQGDGGDFTFNFFSMKRQRMLLPVPTWQRLWVDGDAFRNRLWRVPLHSHCKEALFLADHRDIAYGHRWWERCVDESIERFDEQRVYA